MIDWIRQHRGLAVGGALGALAILVFIFVWFEPHKALLDQRVDEALPGLESVDESQTTTTVPPPTSVPPTTAPADDSAATTTTVPPTTTEPPGPVILSETELASVGRDGSGKVLLIELDDGSRVVRFEDLDVLNGPDLLVILSPSELVDDRDAYDDGDFVVLGELRGNQGNQNYEIPADVDLEGFGSVAIWCRRFNYTFNAAAIDL